jgi:hypothetical protein
MNEVVHEGQQAIEAWRLAQVDLEAAQKRVAEAKERLGKMEERLAKWLKPDDAKQGEKIAIWYKDSLIQVEVGGVVCGENFGVVTPDVVTVRSRGKHFP